MIVQPRKIHYRPQQQKQKSSMKDLNKFQRGLTKNKSNFYAPSEQCVPENKDQQKKAKHFSNASTQQNDEKVCETTYWGQIKPYWIDSKDKTPRICISPSFFRCLLLNLFIITCVCVAVPNSINKNIPLQLMLSTPKLIAKKYSIYMYSAIWSMYELIFLMILLLGNPGHGEPQSKKMISVEQQQQIMNFPSVKKHEGFNKCEICKSFVDNSVYHCEICDLCCQGFSHHCQYIGKCIGYRNQIYLNAYLYGFVIGLIFLVLLRMALFYL